VTFKFEWNEFADQPHNVAPRSERTRHHFRHWRNYLALIGSNLVWLPPAYGRYRRYRRRLYRGPLEIGSDMFGLSVSPGFGDEAGTEAVLALLRETGVRQALFRVPSWEKDRLADHEAFARLLRGNGFGLVAALLQQRRDVLETGTWAAFLEETFARLGPVCRDFEIGHAWNRTKWGVWDHSEYIGLAKTAADLRARYEVRLVGPAVIDFEFHLYPPTLRAVDFDVVSSLLYVDRVGAPENGQFGWTAAGKTALFKAVADIAGRRPRPAWITEFNWPLEGTGRWSPASGRPNVSEEAQADYLVRYYVLVLTTGLVERVYWWQLAAPGYGLVDTRESPWRRRPSFFAFRTMVDRLSGSEFLGRDRPRKGGPPAEVFRFRKDGRDFAMVWTTGAPHERGFDRPVKAVLGRDGKEIPRKSPAVRVDGSPKYVLFE
jgi:hypothetical protein